MENRNCLIQQSCQKGSNSYVNSYIVKRETKTFKQDFLTSGIYCILRAVTCIKETKLERVETFTFLYFLDYFYFLIFIAHTTSLKCLNVRKKKALFSQKVHSMYRNKKNSTTQSELTLICSIYINIQQKLSSMSEKAVDRSKHDTLSSGQCSTGTCSETTTCLHISFLSLQIKYWSPPHYLPVVPWSSTKGRQEAWTCIYYPVNYFHGKGMWFQEIKKKKL